MGELWRASKSRFLKKLGEEQSVREQMEMKPKNIKSLDDWKQFIKAKSSEMFKAKRNKIKEMRGMQFSHTSSRKGYARLKEDMKKQTKNPSEVNRREVWIKGYTKKKWEPFNTLVAKTIEKINAIKECDSLTNLSIIKDDALSKVLGPEKRGRVRGLGKEVTLTKLQIYQQTQDHSIQLQDHINQLEDTVVKLSHLVGTLMSSQKERRIHNRFGPGEDSRLLSSPCTAWWRSHFVGQVHAQFNALFLCW